MFSLLINFDSLLSSFDKLFVDFFRCVLDGGKYINNVWIVKKRSLDICKSFKKIIFVILKYLCVHGDFLLEGLNLIFKMLLLL